MPDFSVRRTLGTVSWRASAATRPEEETEDVERRLKIILAGIVAEAMLSGRKDWDETSEDLDAAVRLAMRLVDDCEDVLPLLSAIKVDVERDRLSVHAQHMPANLQQRQLTAAIPAFRTMGVQLGRHPRGQFAVEVCIE